MCSKAEATVLIRAKSQLLSFQLFILDSRHSEVEGSHVVGYFSPLHRGGVRIVRRKNSRSVLDMKTAGMF